MYRPGDYLEEELKELMECFPRDMNDISESFDHIRGINKKLLIETIIFGILYIGMLLVLIYTFNYLDENYYYWAPALAVVSLGLLTLFLIYNSCRFAASFQLGTHSSYYSKEYSDKIRKHYEKLNDINNKIEIHLE